MCISAGLAGDQTASGAKTVITSNRLTFDYKRSIASFDGNVEVTDPQMNIKADKLTVLFDKDNNVKSATAVGNVRLQSEDRSGTCKKAVYLAKADEVMMLGDAVLKRANMDSLSGHSITFSIGKQTVTCESAELIMYPGGDKKSMFQLNETTKTDPGNRKSSQPARGLNGVRKAAEGKSQETTDDNNGISDEPQD